MKCGAAFRVRAGVLLTTVTRDAVTCRNCLGLRPDRKKQGRRDAARAATIAHIVAHTTLVGGVRREVLPCECGALMVAGIDHTCDPDNRRDGGLTWT